MSDAITLADVSKAAKVSLNTAAKVLSGDAKKARISDKTAKKVQAVAEKLGYTPNIFARNMRAKKSGIVGVCIADMSDQTYIEDSHLILQKIHSKGLTPLLTSAEVGLDICFTQWRQNRIEGLILSGTTKQMDSRFFAKLKRNNITAVIAGCAYYDPHERNLPPEVSVVSIDNRLGMQLAINHLLEKGYRKIAHVGGPTWHADAQERLTAYRETIKPLHRPIVVGGNPGDHFWKLGYNAAAKLCKKHNDINAVVMYADQVAVGAMKYFAEHSISVPEDIAIVSFDNAPEAEYCNPSLTTLNLSAEQVAQQALRLLEESLQSAENIKRIQIPPNLVIRNST
jgi:DNA-binding LacI/PurR family transcriptional regulator